MLDNRHIHARQFKSIWPYINVFFITTDNLTLRINGTTMRMRGICRDFADLQFLKSAKELKLFFFNSFARIPIKCLSSNHELRLV